MKAIAAMSINRSIGLRGKIPWYIKEDFKWFKEFTLNQVLILGHNTYKDLPNLPKRKLLVIDRTKINEGFWNPAIDKVVYFTDKETIIELDGTPYKGELIVAGGGKTYELFLPYIKEFYMTHVNGEYEGDTYMPLFEHLFDKQEVIKEFEGGHKVVKYSK